MRIATKWQDSWSSIAPEAGTRRTRRVVVNGEDFEVVRMGSGDPLVVIPGMAGGWRLCQPLLRRLAKHHEVISYDLRGERPCGAGPLGATRTPHVELGWHAADLAGLIERLGLERPSVLGVSFGGAVALELAVDHPRMIDSLVVHGIESKFRATTAAGIVRHVLERYALPTNSPFINQFLNLLYAKKPEPGPQADQVVERIWRTPQTVMAARLGQLEHFDVTDRLWRVDVPTLVLAGARDVIVPASRQKRLAMEISGARFESIENAGHIAFVTHADAVARQVVAHVQRVKTAV
ncbi:alpha/beta fold hydrolase [Paludisphaera rhizosphaerae]|uniref:alpha/beta fold hydrolase n=1 Tax=Paludisphaera rhizosphaerae TaxID=2711216 RepID=UPI0013EDBD56|nr:alpha/beta fold hydrolase [Paludisphaera rhizosphaerae]